MELMLQDSRLSGMLCGFFGRGARNKQVTEEDQKKIRRRRRVKKVGAPVRKALLAAVCPPLGAG